MLVPAHVSSAVIDVKGVSLEMLTLQLKCEAVLNFVHLTLRVSQADRKMPMFYSPCLSVTCLSYPSVEMLFA